MNHETTTRQSPENRGGNFTRRGVLRTAAVAGAVAAPLPWTMSQASPAAAVERNPVGPGKLRPATEAITPFHLHVPESALEDLRYRLRNTRWPEQELVQDWSQGAPLHRVQRLVKHWETQYDWRRLERRLNSLGQYRTKIDGLGFHFLHVRSPHPDATPIILTHGWPGSVVEFLKVIDPLTNPTAHGGRPGDAFHVVIPSLPGYGFSDKPAEKGWDVMRIAKAWFELMHRLGYHRYIAQGGDWGASVTTAMGKLWPKELIGVHLNLPVLFDAPLVGTPTPEEQKVLKQIADFQANGTAYSAVQRTSPETIGTGLTDSPAGQAAWIYEKFGLWTDSNHNPESIWSYDEMLDDIMLYWLPGTAASAGRLYAESFASAFIRHELDLPVGVTIFPKDIFTAPKVWGERTYHNLVYWNEAKHGGHFAAFEQPKIFTEELRKFARLIR